MEDRVNYRRENGIREQETPVSNLEPFCFKSINRPILWSRHRLRLLDCVWSNFKEQIEYQYYFNCVVLK